MTGINIQIIGNGYTEAEQYCNNIDEAIKYLKRIKKEQQKKEDEENEW